MTVTFGSVFSGCGGLDLGLEQAGMTCRYQIEIDDFALKVLKKHWPDVKKMKDIRHVDATQLENVDLIAGGFPCQPHSVAGKRMGSKDDRNLWGEFFRIIKTKKPRFVLAENVPNLLRSDDGEFFRGVIQDLASVGYRVEWDHVPASSLGAYHRRDRVFIVAYADSERWDGLSKVFSRKPIKNWPKASEYEPVTGNCSGRVRMVPPSGVRRESDGIPSEMDRLRLIGNSVAPPVAEWIGKLIMESMR